MSGVYTQALQLDGRRSMSVLRYHTWPTIRTQTIGDHVANVLRIYVETFGTVTDDETKYILWHDAAEVVTGDSPFDGKRMFPELKKALDNAEVSILAEMTGGLFPVISSDTKLRVKYADLAEMAEFGREEMRLGNVHYGKPIFDKILEYMHEIVARLPGDQRSRCYEWMRTNLES